MRGEWTKDRRPTRTIAPFLLIVLSLFLIYGSEYFRHLSGETLSSIGNVGILVSEFNAPETQWLLAIYIGIHFLGFAIWQRILRRRLTGNANSMFRNSFELCLLSTEVYLILFVGIVAIAYGSRYLDSSVKSDFIYLLTGVTLGQGVKAWRLWRETRNDIRPLQRFLLVPIIFVLALAAILKPDFAGPAHYLGQKRWSGPWENPNTYGLLMGVGMILAVGKAVQGLHQQIQKYNHWTGGRMCWSNFVNWSQNGLFLVLGIEMGLGLVKSYSRGSWLGTLLGFVYLAQNLPAIVPQSSAGPKNFLRRNLRPLAIIIISVLICGFWQFRFVQWHPVHRMFSIANVYDFSCRNRIEAWKGEIRMIANKPLIGYGWRRAESIYEKNFCPPQLQGEGGAAIRTNDVLLIGVIFGIPALGCFLAYVWFTLRDGGGGREKKAGIFESDWLNATCRAGAIVLLVGFFFDGGLFKLSTGSTFWILLELGQAGVIHEPKARSTNAAGAMEKDMLGNDRPCKLRRSKAWLDRIAYALGVIALTETTVLLVTPFLAVNDSTLTLSRHYLVSPSAVPDLNLLATNVDWSNHQLRALLQHASVASYDRQLFNWNVDDEIYHNYILNPLIDSKYDGQLKWRRELWEYFYPPTRKEIDTASAAIIVMKFLNQRISIVAKGPVTIEEIWQQKKADASGFEAIAVAAFRSVGIPARLNFQGRTEFLSNGKWQPVPQPLPKVTSIPKLETTCSFAANASQLDLDLLILLGCVN